MDILTLELNGYTLYQALLDVRKALDAHPGLALRVHLDGDDTLRHNIQRLLEKEGRGVTVFRERRGWRLEAAAGEVPVPDVAPVPAAPLASAFPSAPRPVLLMRGAFAPGDRALGRRLLLETLRGLEPGIPWVGLAHDALDLLADARSLETLRALQARGIPVRVSRASLDFLAVDPEGFEVMEDEAWQLPLGRGALTVL